MPDFYFEKQCQKPLVAGVDEAGRGPWAGVVVASAVVFPDLEISQNLALNLNDSKKLSKEKRQDLFRHLYDSPALIGVGQASVEEIDSLNILQATFLAMQRALLDLKQCPDFVLIDGNKIPKLSCPAKAIVKGDALSLSIAAASIIAKVTRDQLMTDLALSYPFYGWEKNAGYGTKIHQEGLAKFGITPHHRKSYAPIKKILSKM